MFFRLDLTAYGDSFGIYGLINFSKNVDLDALLFHMFTCADSTGEIQAYVLKSFVELMDHGLVSWDILDPKFITTVSLSY